MAAQDIRDLAAVQVGTDLLGSINASRTTINQAAAIATSLGAFVGIGSGPPTSAAPAAQLIYLDQDGPALYLRQSDGTWTTGLAFVARVQIGALGLDFSTLGSLFLL